MIRSKNFVYLYFAIALLTFVCISLYTQSEIELVQGANEDDGEESDLEYLAHIFLEDEVLEQMIPMKLTHSPRHSSVLTGTNDDFDFSLEIHSGFDSKWQNVQGTSKPMSVYSAFHDDRNPEEQLVRILTSTKGGNVDIIWCLFHYRNWSMSRIVPALMNGSSWITCPWAGDEVPKSVSVISEHEKSKGKFAPGNQLKVMGVPQEGQTEPRKRELEICVIPLARAYDKFNEILEFLEMNLILGVEHFTFYLHGPISKEVYVLLEHYKRKGILDTRSWGMESDHLAMNDCLYRAMEHSVHVMVLDVDHLIVPLRDGTLKSMIGSLREEAPWVFQKAVFPLNPTDCHALNDGKQIFSRLNQKVEHIPLDKSTPGAPNFICIPKSVHDISELSRFTQVSPQEALEYQYQACNEAKCPKSALIHRTEPLHDFRNRITTNMQQTRANINMPVNKP